MLRIKDTSLPHSISDVFLEDSPNLIRVRTTAGGVTDTLLSIDKITGHVERYCGVSTKHGLDLDLNGRIKDVSPH